MAYRMFFVGGKFVAGLFCILTPTTKNQENLKI